MAEYIEREALEAHLNRRLKDLRSENGNYDHYTDGYEEAVCTVEEFPAADVAPVVHGRWISWEEAGNYVPSPDRHECSTCHDAAQVLVNGLELLSDYCPSCGAKMDGET